ncbi:unnamed protein product [Amoebophrya sp. A25]|nr:unnamed protein product [Amoebophrya sp. A25]|eukprot:GSA25T00025113001.1
MTVTLEQQPPGDKPHGPARKPAIENKSKHLFSFANQDGKLISLAYWILVDMLIVYVVRSTPEYREFFEDVYYYIQQDLLQPLVHRLAWYSLLSLLSSACCAFQLLLNAFSVGCAGFNTVLGPVRPFFLAITIVSQLCMWFAIEKWAEQFPQAIIATALTSVLSLLPELLELRLMWRSQRGLLRSASRVEDSKISALAESRSVVKNVTSSSSRSSSSSSSQSSITLHLQTEGMGCVACVTAVQGVVAKQFQLESAVDLQAGRVEIFLETENGEEDETSALGRQIAEAVSDAGFPSMVIDALQTDPGSGRSAGENQTVILDATDGENGIDDTGNRESSIEDELVMPLVNGLLGSSCCLIQLVLNLLSAYDVVHIGCAGLNTAIGPLRQQIRTVILGYLGVRWCFTLSGLGSCCSPSPSTARRGVSGTKSNTTTASTSSTSSKSRTRPLFPRPLLRSTLLTLILMFLPELLRFLHTSTQLKTWVPAVAPDMSGGADVETLHYVIDNMGCEACESGVRTILLRHSGVLDVLSVDFESGEAVLVANRAWTSTSSPGTSGSPDDRTRRSSTSSSDSDGERESGDDEEEVDKDKHFSLWEQDLDTSLRKHGYELHRLGWVTKKMKLALQKGHGLQKANPFR